MSVSVVFQAYSETGEYGQDFAIIAASVVEVLRRRGIEALVKNEGAEGATWAEEHGVPEATDDDIAECEVLLRAWPAGQWPTRPDGPRIVVDFVRHASDRSSNADYVVAFQYDETNPFPGLIVWDVLFPLPIVVNETIKSIVESTILIHLGQDPTSRLSGIRTAIEGYSGMNALGMRYPGLPAGGAGIVSTPAPWVPMASGDVCVVTPDFPVHLAAAMRVPAILVANNSGEVNIAQELVSRGYTSFLYLGLLSGLTNNQIRDAVVDLRNDDTLKRVLRLGGTDQRAEQGVMRIVNWVSRELVGEELHHDPFHIQGYDTILDPQESVPLNALDSIADQGEATSPEEAAEVQIEYFFADGTWAKPDGAKKVLVELVGGGSGGGSGRRGANGTARFGGGGGTGASTNQQWFNADSLPATVDVVVGEGGIGGAGVTVDDTNGNFGANGEESKFGDFATSGSNATNYGTGGGGAGTAANGPGGSAQESSEDAVLLGRGSQGANGGTTSAVSAGTPLKRGAAGGGGGTGISALDSAGFPGGNGGAGSAMRPSPHVIAFGQGGQANGDDGGFGGSAETGEATGGGGGGGGAAANGADGGSGGAGGLYGGGGGGGAASENGFTSGAGGTGGNGIVVVTTYF